MARNGLNLYESSEFVDPGFQDQVLEETWPHRLLGAEDQRLGVEQDQLLCGPTGTSSNNCQETETHVVQACHMPQRFLQNYLSGHILGQVTLCSAEEMLDGRHQRADIPAHARTAHNGLPQTRLEGDLCLIVLHVYLTIQFIRGLNWTQSLLPAVTCLCITLSW